MSKQKKKFVNPFDNPGVGRRTGLNLLEGKNIRQLSNGMDNFDDYWSDSSSGTESLLDDDSTPKRSSSKSALSVRSMSPFSAGSRGNSVTLESSRTASGARPTVQSEPAPNVTVTIDTDGYTGHLHPGNSRLGNSSTAAGLSLNKAGDETGTISRNEMAKSRTAISPPTHQSFRTKKRLTYSRDSSGQSATPSSSVLSVESDDSPSNFKAPIALAPRRSTRASAKQQTAKQSPTRAKSKSPTKTQSPREATVAPTIRSSPKVSPASKTRSSPFKGSPASKTRSPLPKPSAASKTSSPSPKTAEAIKTRSPAKAPVAPKTRSPKATIAPKTRSPPTATVAPKTRSPSPKKVRQFSASSVDASPSDQHESAAASLEESEGSVSPEIPTVSQQRSQRAIDTQPETVTQDSEEDPEPAADLTEETTPGFLTLRSKDRSETPVQTIDNEGNDESEGDDGNESDDFDVITQSPELSRARMKSSSSQSSPKAQISQQRSKKTVKGRPPKSKESSQVAVNNLKRKSETSEGETSDSPKKRRATLLPKKSANVKTFLIESDSDSDVQAETKGPKKKRQTEKASKASKGLSEESENEVPKKLQGRKTGGKLQPKKTSKAKNAAEETENDIQPQTQVKDLKQKATKGKAKKTREQNDDLETELIETISPSKKKLQPKKSAKAKLHTDQDFESDEEEAEEEPEIRPKKTKGKSSNQGKQTSKKGSKQKEQTEITSLEEEEEEEVEIVKKGQKQGRKSSAGTGQDENEDRPPPKEGRKQNKQKGKKVQESDEGDEEDEDRPPTKKGPKQNKQKGKKVQESDEDLQPTQKGQKQKRKTSSDASQDIEIETQTTKRGQKQNKQKGKASSQESSDDSRPPKKGPKHKMGKGKTSSQESEEEPPVKKKGQKQKRKAPANTTNQQDNELSDSRSQESISEILSQLSPRPSLSPQKTALSPKKTAGQKKRLGTKATNQKRKSAPAGEVTSWQKEREEGRRRTLRDLVMFSDNTEEEGGEEVEGEEEVEREEEERAEEVEGEDEGYEAEEYQEIRSVPLNDVNDNEEESGEEEEGEEEEEPPTKAKAVNKNVSQVRKSILNHPTPPTVTKRRNSKSGGSDQAVRKSSRARSKPVAWYDNEVPNYSVNLDVTNAEGSYLAPPPSQSAPKLTSPKSNSDVGDELSPPVVKKPRRRKAQRLSATPAGDMDATQNEVVVDIPQKAAKPASRKSILKTHNPARMSVGAAHFTEDLPTYSPSGSPGKSRLALPRYSTASPLHINDITCSQTPAPLPAQQRPKKQVKIMPPESDEEGRRRSKRTRVKPLDWYRNERIIYQRRKSGGLVVAGIDSPPEDGEVLSKEKKLKKLIKKRRDKTKAPKTPRRLSTHTGFEDDLDALTTTEVAVLNPDTQQEVSVDCIRSRDTLTFRGPHGGLPYDDDPFIMTKAIVQLGFAAGKLIFQPLGEKGKMLITKDTVVFYIVHGKLGVTIHETTTTLESGDFFFVPKGNTYSIKNLRNEEAKVVFFQLKH